VKVAWSQKSVADLAPLSPPGMVVTSPTCGSGGWPDPTKALRGGDGERRCSASPGTG
jgi:hypothetical protein